MIFLQEDVQSGRSSLFQTLLRAAAVTGAGARTGLQILGLGDKQRLNSSSAAFSVVMRHVISDSNVRIPPPGLEPGSLG